MQKILNYNPNPAGMLLPRVLLLTLSLALLFSISACDYQFDPLPTPRTTTPANTDTPVPDRGNVISGFPPAVSGFLTQTDGDSTGRINLDTLGNPAGRVSEIFDFEDTVLGSARELPFVTLTGSSAIISKGEDFNLILLESNSATESLVDRNHAFMGLGYDGYVQGSQSLYRFVGYSGYNYNPTVPPAPLTSADATATYTGRLGIIAASNNTADDARSNLLVRANLLNASSPITLTVQFGGSNGTLRGTASEFVNVGSSSIELDRTTEAGCVAANMYTAEVRGRFVGGQPELSGSVIFNLPGIFDTGDEARSSVITTSGQEGLQGVVNKDIAIGAFHGARSTAAVVGGFVATPASPPMPMPMPCGK